MYSVELINEKGGVSYLSVKGRTEWKTKRTARKHRDDILNCKRKPWSTMTADVVDQFGEVVK